MTEQIKKDARELVDRYYTTGYAINIFYAKQCAIILCDSHIEEENSRDKEPSVTFIEKWQKIKEYIQTKL